MEDNKKEEVEAVEAEASESNETKAEVKDEKPVEEKKSKKVLNFFITTLNGMAYGLFATLIISHTI